MKPNGRTRSFSRGRKIHSTLPGFEKQKSTRFFFFFVKKKKKKLYFKPHPKAKVILSYFKRKLTNEFIENN